MAIAEGGEFFVCDFCGDDTGKFNSETGNHWVCERAKQKLDEKDGIIFNLRAEIDTLSIASASALNEICTIIGAPTWDYPAQVVRDVEAYKNTHQELVEKINDTIREFKQWRDEAYPLDIFPEPDMKQVQGVLEFAHIRLDSVSAHMLRHVVKNAVEKLEKLIGKDDHENIPTPNS